MSRNELIAQLAAETSTTRAAVERMVGAGLVILLYKLPSWRGVGEGEVGSRRLGPVR